MPLPPAPTRRGSQLAAGDFSAKTNAKSRASAAAARDEQDDDLFDLDPAPAAVAAAPMSR
ncbi:hypothetical protein [Comamonas sp.]|uniref:hypothetical protein n=1 Tax=Comamonas sp. TaxID=34028 RepID=UPI00289D1D3D|nr:hypothetical protein [Comamonas sp.]